MHKIALLVGIDEYSHAPLSGCVADAKRIGDTLSHNEDGSPNFDCRTLLSSNSEVTRSLLRNESRDLFRKGDIDTAVFYFAGHGANSDASGGMLVTQDGKHDDEGISMQEVVALANNSPSRERIIILDCCHAGAIGELLLTNTPTPLAEGVSILAACRDRECAVEVDGMGLFSSRIADALRGDAADVTGKITVAGIYAYVDEVSSGWEQRPLFKSNLSKITEIRHVAPVVELAALRRIVEYFPTPEMRLGLDPSYEPTAEPRNENNEAIFSELQSLRAARLVAPIDTPHMYYAALECKSCSLTPLGRFYWHRVKNGQI